MTHTGSLNKVVFGPDSVEISYISTQKIIVKSVANHASKAYEFSHFLQYSAPATFNKSEEDGKFHMHIPRMLMHRRTMILQGCSTKLQIAAKFSQFFAQREKK